MVRPTRLEFDKIGYWSEIKLDIVREYAAAYSRILAKQKGFQHVYIDAFAGAGRHESKTTGEHVAGSPLNALQITPRFHEYHLIELDPAKAGFLKEAIGDRPGVYVYEGDCNEILLTHVFPRVRYEDYRRGLCLLDPYGLHLNWEVIRTAGETRAIDLFLNFPVADINRNVLWHDPKAVDPADIERMSAFWGDESWRDAAYSEEPPDLFGYRSLQKNPNEMIAGAFRERLRTVAKFGHVPEPIPMRNTKGAVVYYLFFASQKPVAQHIVEDIFKKYKDRKSA